MSYFFCLIRSSQDREPMFAPSYPTPHSPGPPPQCAQLCEFLRLLRSHSSQAAALLLKCSRWLSPSATFTLFLREKLWEYRRKHTQKPKNMCQHIFPSETSSVSNRPVSFQSGDRCLVSSGDLGHTVYSAPFTQSSISMVSYHREFFSSIVYMAGEALR